MSGKCIYCGRPAKYYLKWKKAWCCEDNWSKCPVKRKETSDRLKGRISPMKGKKHTDETKKKIGNSKLGKPRDDNTKRKLSEFRKGKKLEEIVGIKEAKRLKEEKRQFLNSRPDIKYNNKGKTYKEIMGKEKSDFHRRRLKELTGEKNPFFGKKHSKKFTERIKKSWTKSRRDKQRKRCLNGHAIYMLQCNTNPSKPQVELYQMILKLCPYAILNYPCLNYSIDIAIPFLNIAIEYDEPYWHQDKESDEKRQKKLEYEGWKFFRFEKIPEKSNLKNIFKEGT